MKRLITGVTLAFLIALAGSLAIRGQDLTASTSSTYRALIFDTGATREIARIDSKGKACIYDGGKCKPVSMRRLIQFIRATPLLSESVRGQALAYLGKPINLTFEGRAK